MGEHAHHHDNGGNGKRGRWVFWGFALVAGFYLITEHRAHLYGILPYLLVLACPLMHLFHGHGGHKHDHSEERTTEEQSRADRHQGH